MCLNNPRSYYQIFNVAGPELITSGKYLDTIANESGVRLLSLRLPIFILKVGSCVSEWIARTTNTRPIVKKVKLNYFPEENIKIIIFEDFIKYVVQTYRDILAFLCVENNFIPSFKVHNPNEKPRNYTINKIILNSNIKKVIQDLTPVPIYNKYKSLGKRVLLKREPRKPLDPTFRKELMYQFKSEVQKTSDLIGIDLVKKWGYKKI